MMQFETALDFANLFFAGILAGMEIVIHYGLHGPSQALDERAQLQLRKALIMRLRVLVPAFFLPSALSAGAIAVLDRDTTAFVLRVVVVVAMVLWIVIRVVGTVPINSATVDWDVNAPPADWKARVTSAERFHIVGVWAAVVAFAASLVATALQRT